MNPAIDHKDTEFIWRRTFEEFSNWVVAVPVLFALLVLLLVVIFRPDHKLRTLVWGLVLVGVFAAVQIPLSLLFKPWFSWWVVLTPTLAIALFYVGMMYRQDAQSIHPLWAGFLGFLRCAIYAIIAFVFLLPGCQTFDKTEIYPKVLMLFDVSGSMNYKDMQPGQKRDTLLSRQEHVIKQLTKEQGNGSDARTFLAALADKSPVSAYRFGAVADDAVVTKFDKDNLWAVPDMTTWLHPKKEDIVVPPDTRPEDRDKKKAQLMDLYESLVSGTNVGGSALQVLKSEASNYLQAIVIFSDGQSNLGSDQAINEFLGRVGNPSRPIHVFTVGVGDFRQPANIRIDDLQAPQVARPDDKFPVRVPVVGSPPLVDEEFEVTLELVRTKDSQGNPLKGDKKYALPVKKGKFKGAGDHPQDIVEFEVDLQELRGVKASADKEHVLEGEWEFVARVPRHPKESFDDKEHKSDPPTRVLVQNKELRVLLVAGGPNRDYQFVRTLLYRETLEKRVELTVYLQTANQDNDDINQDVPAERLLQHFPNRLGQDDPKDKYSSLNMFDVIIAYDVDWLAMEPAQLKLLEEWVGTHAGGLIFVGGPVNTYQLARSREELTPIKTIFPVLLKDYRLTPLGLGLGIDTSRPYPLRFTPAAKNYDFFKLDEKDEFGGWDKFFWGGKKPENPKDVKPVRGMYSYYPVDKVKPGSTVLATFVGPEATRINDGKDEQPWLVTMPFGNGKTVYVSSAETWRLRLFKEAFHERFWIKLARFVASGSQQQKKYGRILLGRKVPAGSIAIEAQIKGSNLLPLSADAKPAVIVRKRGAIDAKPETYYLRAKPTQGDWHGWFMGSVKVREPGEYEFSIPIPNTSETLSHVLEVFRPNLEEQNLRENHKALYQIATDAAPILNRLPKEVRDEVQPLLPVFSDDVREGKETRRLFFPLKNSDAILKCIAKLEPKRERTKGALQDLWDRGLETGLEVDTFYLALLGPLALGVLACAILMYMQQMVAGLAALLASVGVSLVVVAVNLIVSPEWAYWPVDFSFVMVTVVTLFGIEWLTRKLLRLA